jgi:hypothetical protein
MKLNSILVLLKVKRAINNACSVDDIISRHIREEMLLNNSMHSDEKGVAGFDEQSENIIVSLTTHGKRIHDVHLTIESLLNQTHKPNKVTLWLAEDEFNERTIPLLLKRQQTRGLEIVYCEDLKSYTKLIPALGKYPDHIIITVDDDVLYPFNLIENLYKAYLEDRRCVYYARGHKMTWGDKHQLRNYRDWIWDYKGEEKSMLHFPTGCGGVLYPPQCFHKDILRNDLFLKLAPTADDVWFKAMTLLQGYPCKRIVSGDKYIDTKKHQDIALYHINNTNNNENMNDISIRQVFNYYNLWEKLKNYHYAERNN